jgi:di/tricarboxylate transporter
MDLYLTIAIIAIGIFLFVRDVFTIDTTSILIMALFIVAGVLSPEEGFAGFNHPATLTLGCMFVVSAAVFKSGLINGLAGTIVKIAKIHYLMALMVFCFIAALFSAFVNDSAIVAILIPIALSVCRDSGIAPSKLLIPISFSALFGGTCTLIGTSTNILVSSIAEKSGFEPLGMFEFSLPAVCLLAIGLLYLFILAPFILPKRADVNTTEFANTENYATELLILEGNKDIGKPILKSSLTQNYAAQVVGIHRNGDSITPFDRETILQLNDKIKIIVSPQKLTEIRKNPNFKITGSKDQIAGIADQKIMYETLIPVGSVLAGNSLKQFRFRDLYNCSVLAVRHRDETIQENISQVTIKEGDLLLIYAAPEEMKELLQQKLVILLSEYTVSKINYKKAIPALLIAIGVVVAAATNITSILISGMIGCLLLVTTNLLKPKEAYEAIEWKVIFMMAGVLSMGAALEKTGGAQIISDFVFTNMGSLDPRITLSLIFLITFLSTNVLSSKATAALMAPIVISLAAAMQISHKPFLVAVMFACSLTFMTPMSYPTNTMVYGPGNYRFNDFLKVGTPLNIIIWLAASFIIPYFLPF